MENVYASVTALGIDIQRADLWAIAGRAAADYGMEGMPNHRDYDSTQRWKTVVQGTFFSDDSHCKDTRIISWLETLI